MARLLRIVRPQHPLAGLGRAVVAEAIVACAIGFGFGVNFGFTTSARAAPAPEAPDASPPAGARAVGRAMPVAFVDDRVFIVGRDHAVGPIRFYTDSGGGFNAVAADTATRLALSEIGTLPGEAGQPASTLVAFPAALTDAGVPPSDFGGPFRGGLVVVPTAQLTMGGDGFLGGRWFDGHVWTFDYGARTLTLEDGAPFRPMAHRVALGFQTESGGRRTTAFARMPIRVDGEALDMLLDTGATVQLTARSAPVFDREADALIGGSFIAESILRRWAERHPDWRVVPDGDRVTGKLATLIEVPRVEVAGLSVGPVWFAARPDRAFQSYMASMMDRPVEGAIGGSAFRYLKMTIDYPAATASFEPSAAKP